MVIDRETKQCYKRAYSKTDVSDGVFVEHTKYLNEKSDFGGVKNHDWHTFIKVIIYVYNFHLVHIFSNFCSYLETLNNDLIFSIVRSTFGSPK